MRLAELTKLILASRKPPPALGVDGQVAKWLKPVRMHTANCYQPVLVGEENAWCRCGLSLTRIGATYIFLSEAFNYGSNSYAWFILDDAQIKIISVDKNFDIRECFRLHETVQNDSSSTPVLDE